MVLRKRDRSFAKGHGQVLNLRAIPQFAKSYYYLLSKSIVTRWFLYIFPIMVVSDRGVQRAIACPTNVLFAQLLWIPGIVWLAGVRHARVWGVNLVSRRVPL